MSNSLLFFLLDKGLISTSQFNGCIIFLPLYKRFLSIFCNCTDPTWDLSFLV
jgi:hypothetical protein